MAITLRDTFGVNIGNDDAAIAAEQARARDMWAPTKAYAARRINNDINYNNAAEAGLRAAGRVAEADALAAETAALNQRQAMYAPEVGKVEDIRGVGDGLSWLGTQVGQGAASMQDPMALSAVAQGVGTLTRNVPGLRGISALAPLAGALGAFGINQRQMTGEMYGRLKEDKQAMDSMSPSQANLYSNLYGAGAGVLETALPHVVGGALGGAALHKGLAQTAARKTSALTRTAGGAAMEGLTELGQQEMQIQGHNLINPLRNRDEDFSERLNAFAGGAAGGLGPSAAGALASNAYSGANRVGEVVSEKAGEMVDLAGSKLPGAQQALGEAVDAAKGAVEKSGAKTKLGDIIDIGKQAWGDVKGLREGPEDREGALTAARAQYERYSLSPEMRSVIDAVPGPDDDVAAWSAQNIAEKQRLIPEHMDALAEAGDERAKALADAIYGDDPVASLDAIEEAGRYLQDRDIVAQQDLRTAAAQHRVGGVTQRLIRGAAKAAMTAAGAVGSMAKVVGNAAADGAREGAQAAKRNMQGAGITTLDYDTWKASRDKNALPTDTPEAQRTHAIQKAVEGRSAKAALEPKFQEDPEAKARSRERATLFAEIMAAEATARRAKLIGTQADDGVADFTNFVRGIGYEVSDMAEAWAARGAESKSKRPTERDAAQAENSVSLLDSLAGDMILATGEMAPVVVARMAEGADAAQKPFWSMLQERIDNWDETQGDREQARTTMQDRMVALLPQGEQAAMLENGGAGAKQLLDFVQQIGRGQVSRAQRKALEGHIGAEALNKMLTIAGAAEEQRRGVTPGETVEDAGAAARPKESDEAGADTSEEASAFEQRQAERTVNSGSGPSGYNFARTGLQSVRTPTSLRPDPLAPDAKTGKRPALFNTTLADDTAVGKAALDKKLADVTALHDGASGALDVKAKTLAEVFKDLNYSEEQQFALFRDYLRQEGATEDAGAKADFVQSVMDGKYKHVAGVGRVRAAMAQFAKDRSIVVTEQGTQRERLDMPHGTLVSLGKGGDLAMSSMRKDAMAAGKRGTPEFRAAMAKAMADSNIMVFKAAEGKNVMGRTGEDRDVFISADRLVKWVRSRGAEEGSTRKDAGPKAAHERYLSDLMDGMQAVMSSSYTDGELPYMVSADGKKRSFADGLPPSLRLGMRKVSSFEQDAPTAAALEKAREEHLSFYEPPSRLEGKRYGEDARHSAANQEAVGKDQEHEVFVPDADGGDSRPVYRTVTKKGVRKDGTEVTVRDQFVPARADEDNQTPLDATQDKRFGNAKTEREDLADRTTKKAADLDGRAAREVAAKGPKSSSAPAGAPNHAIAHRVRARVGLQAAVARGATDVQITASAARQRVSELGGVSRAAAMEDPQLSALMGELVAAKLAGKDGADAAISAVNGALVDTFSFESHKPLNVAILDRVRAGATLGDAMELIADSAAMTDGTRAVARAVRQIAGKSTLGFEAMEESTLGRFDPKDGATYLAQATTGDANVAHTALHEGVHAATVRGLAQNKELYQATYDLMDHIAKHDKDLAAAYGMTNVLEFVAEAMSNQALQRRLYKIPASKKVEQYLGRTVANAWDGFVALVGKALGLPEGRHSALNQIIELSGRAMKATGQDGDTRLGLTGKEFGERMRAVKADPARIDDALSAIAKHPAFAEGAGQEFVDRLKANSGPEQMNLHVTLTALEQLNTALDDAPKGAVGVPDASGALGSIFHSVMQSPDNLIAHRMSDQIHEELGNAGFGATHDSPTRHDGRFDWRKHIGSGEGQAVFGAGTYLSTADETHDFYKQQFSVGSRGFEYKGKVRTAAVDPDLNAAERMVLNTLLLDPSMTAEDAKANAARFLPNLVQLGEVEKPAGKTMQQFIQETTDAITPGMVGEFKRPEGASPTYHVSVNAGATEIMGWDAPFREQSWPVQAAMYDAASAAKVADPTDGESGAQFYKRLASKLGSQRAASEALQDAGVVGHAYGASGGTERQYPNYVIYDDARIKTNYVHFNRQKVNEDVAPDHAQVAEAKAYLNRVLGGQIKAEFKEITGYSGEWVEAENTVRVSTITSAGTMNVARHEALHAFFSKFIKANPRVVRALSSLTDDPRVVRRLEALLADDPAALAQLADGEERLAYIYQFAMAGVMSLPRTAGTTVMGKVRKFLRRVFMMVSDQERAVDLLYAFEHGEMSQPSSAQKAVARVMAQGTWASGMARKMDAITQRAAALTVPAETILAMSKSPTAREIGKLFFTNPGDETAVGADGQHGYINDRNQKMRQYDNLFRGTIAELDDQQMSSLIDAMQREVPTDQVKDPAVADARKRLLGMFERFHRYLTDEKGLPISKINENYFPAVWDSHRIAQDPSQFADMLRAKYSDVIADMAKSWARERDDFYAANGGAPSNLEVIDSDFVIHELTSRVSRGAGVDDEGIHTPKRQDGVLRPWMAASKKRTLNFIAPEDRAPFLEKNLVKTLTRYVRQGVHTAEYAQRFGREGEELGEMLAQAKTELQAVAQRMKAEGEFKTDKARDDWVRRQYRDVANSVGGMEGSLGNDIKDWQRNVNSWAIVYQNVRLLPLALFSSFVDPLGLVTRGGTMKEAFTTFVEGMRGVARQWGDMIREVPADRRKDQWEALAEHAGVIDGAVFSHLISDEYGSVYLEGKTKKINEIMFKANGMEAWNRAMRVGATRSAVAFIERHAKLPDQHSRRWLQELGLDPNRLPMDSDGKLITDRGAMQAAFPDMSRGEAEEATARVHSALVRWVEGAVLSPNAAQRPAWGSDPHYSMFWHLKQFAYSFHQTLIKRAMQEAKHGNYMPLGVFGWYIPTMIAADVTKGLMMGGGSLPNYMKGYDLGDWVVHGVDRAGVLGIGQVGTDALKNPMGMAGPSVEQILDVFTDPVEKTMTGALPMHSLTGKVFS